MLPQPEADELLRMAKRFEHATAVVAVPPGADETYELAAENGREKFLLDVWRGTFRISKLKLQNRVRTAVVLARLDVHGAPHTNPDLTRIGGTHLHLYREGYEDRWAFPVDPLRFPRLGDTAATFHDFCRYCHVIAPPAAQGWLT